MRDESWGSVRKSSGHFVVGTKVSVVVSQKYRRDDDSVGVPPLYLLKVQRRSEGFCALVFVFLGPVRCHYTKKECVKEGR